MTAFSEGYNGFGYRNKGKASAYATAGTNLYQGGRYVADYVYSDTSWDQRPGVMAIILELMNQQEN